MRFYCSLNLLNNYWTFLCCLFCILFIIVPPKEKRVQWSRKRGDERDADEEREGERADKATGATTTANKYNANYQWTAWYDYQKVPHCCCCCSGCWQRHFSAYIYICICTKKYIYLYRYVHTHIANTRTFQYMRTWNTLFIQSIYN